MRSLLIVLTVVGVAVAKPGYLGLGLGARSLLHAPVAYSSVAAPLAYSTVAAAPVAHHIAAPLSVSSQYHAQDELGQYSYGYAGGPSAKSEVKTFDGVTRGGYSYVDANGVVQSVNYVADAVNGFRVAATNLPVAPEPIPAEPLVAPVPVEDTVEVAAAKQAHFSAVAEARASAEAAPEVVQAVAVEPAAVTIARGYHPALAYGAVAPAAVSYSSVAAAPIAYGANVAPIHYSAVAPAIAHGHLAYAAAPVQVFNGIADTVEVAAAKAQHYAAHLEAKARLHGLY